MFPFLQRETEKSSYLHLWNFCNKSKKENIFDFPVSDFTRITGKEPQILVQSIMLYIQQKQPILHLCSYHFKLEHRNPTLMIWWHNSSYRCVRKNSQFLFFFFISRGAGFIYFILNHSWVYPNLRHLKSIGWRLRSITQRSQRADRHGRIGQPS